MRSKDEGNRFYKVVINQDEQCSLWFADRDNPPGWKDTGMVGTKMECLEYLDEGTDMRPASLRKYLEAQRRAGRGARRAAGVRI